MLRLRRQLRRQKVAGPRNFVHFLKFLGGFSMVKIQSFSKNCFISTSKWEKHWVKKSCFRWAVSGHRRADISKNRVYVFTHCSYRKESLTLHMLRLKMQLRRQKVAGPRNFVHFLKFLGGFSMVKIQSFSKNCFISTSKWEKHWVKKSCFRWAVSGHRRADISKNRVYVFTHCSYRKESFPKDVQFCLRIFFCFLGYG